MTGDRPKKSHFVVEVELETYGVDIEEESDEDEDDEHEDVEDDHEVKDEEDVESDVIEGVEDEEDAKDDEDTEVEEVKDDEDFEDENDEKDELDELKVCSQDYMLYGYILHSSELEGLKDIIKRKGHKGVKGFFYAIIPKNGKTKVNRTNVVEIKINTSQIQPIEAW